MKKTRKMSKIIPIRLNYFHNNKHYVVAAEVERDLKLKSMTVFLIRGGKSIATIKTLDVTHGMADSIRALIASEVIEKAHEVIKKDLLPGKINKNLLQFNQMKNKRSTSDGNRN